MIYKNQSKRIYRQFLSPVSYSAFWIFHTNVGFSIRCSIHCSFRNIVFRDIFIRYKLKLKGNKEKEKEKREKEKYISWRRNISTIALSLMKFAVSAAVKIIDNDNWIGSQAKAFTNSRARARICVCACVFCRYSC